MKRYVVGLMFDNSMKNIVLIRKNRPKWQAGKLNGVGGHIEEGETPIEAMVREYAEEAGIETEPAAWQHVLTLRFAYAEVDFFAGRDDIYCWLANTMTDEEVVKVPIIDLDNTIDNIPPIILLSIQRLWDREEVAPIIRRECSEKPERLRE